MFFCFYLLVRSPFAYTLNGCTERKVAGTLPSRVGREPCRVSRVLDVRSSFFSAGVDVIGTALSGNVRLKVRVYILIPKRSLRLQAELYICTKFSFMEAFGRGVTQGKIR